MQRKAILAGVSAVALLMVGAGVASAQDSARSKVENISAGNLAVDNGSTRTNDATDSFNDAAGIVTIQKNNGSNNSIGAADDVQVDAVSNNDLRANAKVKQATFDNDTVANQGSRSNDITNSFNGFDGIATVQQNNGDNNVIGAATTVHSRFDDGGDDFGDVKQKVVVKGLTEEQFGPGLFEGILDNNQLRENNITDSFEDASGIANVQQNNGSGNAVGAANSVAVDIGGVDAGSPGDPGKNADQRVKVIGYLPGSAVTDLNSDRSNDITNSFNGFDGIANVQQNNGDVNILGVGNAVMANIGLGREPELNNDVDQRVKVKGVVKRADSFDVDSPDDLVDGARDNAITGSFGGASGIANVQQNNGSQNVMGIGNAVQANIDSSVRDLDGDDDVDQGADTIGVSAGNTAQSHGFALDPDDTHRSNDISDSFDGFSGIANVQQNNGDNNVIGSSNAVVASIRTDDVVDDIDGSSANTYAKVFFNEGLDQIPDSLANDGTNRRNEINESFNGAQGILNVQQNNGNNNVLGVANTVTANVENTGADFADEANTFSDATAYVVLNRAVADGFVDRDNEINNSFNDAAGLVNVQQNNGDNNALNASNAVGASLNNDLADGFGGTVSAATLSATVAGNDSIIGATLGGGGYNNSITDSGNGFNGIAVIQQNNGNNNAIQSSIAVTANVDVGGFAGGDFLGGLNR